jgi:UPF0716 protein FxsA
VLALFLLFPPTRAVVRRRLLRRRAPRTIVVDSEVVREEPIVIDSVREDRD